MWMQSKYFIEGSASRRTHDTLLNRAAVAGNGRGIEVIETDGDVVTAGTRGFIVEDHRDVVTTLGLAIPRDRK